MQASTNDEAPDPQEAGTADRRRWMSVLARADAGDLERFLSAALDGGPALPARTWLRRPEIGAVMVQGRMGGDGAAFAMGEMTVTRAALRLDCGTTGFGYVAGRETAKAGTAALVDALMQRADWRARIETGVIRPLAQATTERREHRARKAAATQVRFFTMARGEDAR